MKPLLVLSDVEVFGPMEKVLSGAVGFPAGSSNMWFTLAWNRSGVMPLYTHEIVEGMLARDPEKFEILEEDDPRVVEARVLWAGPGVVGVPENSLGDME